MFAFFMFLFVRFSCFSRSRGALFISIVVLEVCLIELYFVVGFWIEIGSYSSIFPDRYMSESVSVLWK